MGILADTVEEVRKLPPPARIGVLAGGAALLVLIYLRARKGGSAGTAAPGAGNGIGLAPSTDYGTFTIPGGPPTSGGTSSGGSSSSSTTGSSTSGSTKSSTGSSSSSSSTIKYYTVKSGDTLGDIGYRYHIAGGATTLFNLNRDKISNINLIYPGQVLRLS